MANVNAPSGFRVIGHVTGGTPARLQRYHIASALANNIYRGDAVIPTGTTKNIDRPGGAAVRLLGVFDGVYYVDTNGDTFYRPRWPTGQTVLTGSTPDAWVYDDPKLLFEIQASGAFVLGDIGSFASLLLGTGNNTTGQSGDQLDSTTFGSGANVKIMDYVDRPDNEVGTNAKLVAAIALHYLAGAMTTI